MEMAPPHSALTPALSGGHRDNDQSEFAVVGQAVRGQQGRARRHMEAGKEREIEQRLEQGEDAQQRRQDYELLRGPAAESDGQKKADQKQILEVEEVAGQFLGLLLSREQRPDQQGAQITLDAHTIE